MIINIERYRMKEWFYRWPLFKSVFGNSEYETKLAKLLDDLVYALSEQEEIEYQNQQAAKSKL